MLKGDYREVITVQIPQNTLIERIDKDALYNEALYWVNKLLETLNEDERSAVYKYDYISLFNILMSATVNDNKKSQKTIEQLTKGFDLITNCCFDDYFNHYGLMEFEHQNAKGLNDLMKQFKDCEDEYKHQFFAGSVFGS